jgi:predicted DNA-binding protein with PD1-like motif
VIRLENGETVHEEIEKFAKEHAIKAASLVAVGGVDADSRLIVGPRDGETRPPSPMEHILGDVHEIAGTGTIFPDEEGIPILHMHMACGREDRTVTGCVRNGVKVWHILEVILFEVVGSTGKRVLEKETGFKLLHP